MVGGRGVSPLSKLFEKRSFLARFLYRWIAVVLLEMRQAACTALLTKAW
jgi:hypothetical protein